MSMCPKLTKIMHPELIERLMLDPHNCQVIKQHLKSPILLLETKVWAWKRITMKINAELINNDMQDRKIFKL